MATHLTVGGSIGFGLGILFDHRYLAVDEKGGKLYNESNLLSIPELIPFMGLVDLPWNLVATFSCICLPLHLVVYVYLDI